jgi:MoCo/4Fe-4S cofactor protein with predicted Tat translocation signal
MIQIKTKQTGKKYWRSLDQLAQTPAFMEWLHREFPSSAEEVIDGASRRNVLKLMAASFGLAGLTACRRPVEHILPNVKGVEDYIPGKPYFYATAMVHNGVAQGLLAEVNDGRPTKMEGNPEHPFSLGAANVFQQAAILGLYDPDRARSPRQDGKDVDWKVLDDALKTLSGSLGQGEGLRFLSESVTSPSFAAVQAAALAKFPKAKWIQYDAISQDEVRAGAQLAFGQQVVVRPRFDKAKVILALDSDFLGLDADTVLPVKEFSRGRKVAAESDEMSRLYVAESRFSTTGATADHRIKMRASEIKAFVSDLAAALKVGGNELKVVGQGDKKSKWIEAVAKDLGANRGKSLVVAGPRQPAAVHAMVHLINQALGNAGETVTYYKSTLEQTRPQLEAIAELAGEMSKGQVSTLVILGGNPVYSAPVDLDLAANIKKVATSIYVGLDVDETAVACKWSVAEAHFLESWGDALAPDGTATIQQPMIAPLYYGRTQAEIVAALTGYKDQKPYDIVRNYWTAKFAKGDADKMWRHALHDGVIPNTAFAEVKPVVDAKKVNGAIQPAAQGASGMELVFTPNWATWDGRYANNGWLQEIPEPMSKITWDNAALVSPATAKQLGVSTHGWMVKGYKATDTEGHSDPTQAGNFVDMIQIEVDGRTLEAPVFVQPGQADGSITLALGYGRTECGHVAKGAGVNAYKLRTSKTPWIVADAKVSKIGKQYQIVQTQEHGTMEDRPLLRESTLEEYRKEPNVIKEMLEVPELVGLYGDWDYSKGNQWGMSIDLNACVGCNACTIACQAENNIPIVGKDQVNRGREMHWIRMDRYFAGDEDEPQAVMSPVPCMQCETAPCENVCPVAATTHSPEGLNDMAYNRCVGTRYCSNNCPYKVRRFNFLAWNYGTPEVEMMKFNPDVTVRMRGVMEKCTYCVQRIQETKIQAKLEGHRPIKDGEIQTACQQTCPADAIVFGNINDPNSRVSKLKKQKRNYGMLEELNTKPRTTYLAKLRNTNEELEAKHG